MTLRIAICDDTTQDINNLIKLLDSYIIAYDVNLDIDIFNNGTQLIQKHAENPYQLILLDIEMQEQSGMNIANYIRNQLNDDVYIVFITSYPQYMKDSFEVQPFQFLTKPVSYPVIEKLITDIINHYKSSHTTKIIISNDGEECLIHINNILYMRATKNKKPILEYVMTNKIIMASGTIQNWENELSDYGFISPCRGYLVNVRHIHSFNNTFLTLDNKTEIPISRRKIKIVKQTYANRIIHIMN